MSTNKVCIKCSKEKSIKHFHKQCSSKDGYNSSCKPCRKIQQQAYRETEKGKAKDKKYNESSKRYECLYKYWNKNPLKKYFQTKLSNALRNGKIINPSVCENCESSEQVEGHHWNYSENFALDIIWVCKYCHEREHERIKILGYPPVKSLWVQKQP